VVRVPPRSLHSLWGHTWTRFFRWKDIGRTVIRPISLRRVTTGAHVFLAVLHSNQITEILNKFKGILEIFVYHSSKDIY